MEGCDHNKSNELTNKRCFTIRERLFWRTVTHALCVLHHSYIGLYSLLLDLQQSKNPIFINMYKYRPAYLTGWNMLFQGIFLLLSLTYDLLEWQNSHDGAGGKSLRYWRDVLYAGLVVPVTLFVTAIFWGTYAVDRQLIFPVIYEEMLPWWLNFCVHGCTNIILILETLFEERRESANKNLELFLAIFFSNGYAVMLFSIYFFDGVWLYEFYKVLSFWQICLHQTLCSVSFIVFYVIQYPIHRFIHDGEGKPQEKGD